METTELTVRRLTEADAETARRLGFEAFGFPSQPPDEPATIERPGRIVYGAFEGDRLLAKMADRAYDSWFGGREVATCGIASVTVAMEDRGRGVLRPLFATTLEAAVARGAVISTLFATAPGIYHRFGYATVVDYQTVKLPTGALAAVGPGSPSISARRAELADLPAVRAVYEGWAAAQNGPLTRRGPSFIATDADFLAAYSGITVAEDSTAGTIVGFASWNRGQRYGPEAAMHVGDLLALDPDAYRVLLRSIGSFASVAPTTTIDTSGDDLARQLLPSSDWPVTHADPYMLLVLDVPGALAARGYPVGLEVEVSFAVEGHVVPEQNSGYRFSVANGQGRCERGGSGEVTLRPAGLALLYAGRQTCANLRFLGLLRGGTPRTDAALDLAFAGRPFHIRDYF